MNEAIDKVRGVRELPLFPLPVVLFPGVPLPLHIFEPRYRQMLQDIRATNSLFALAYFDATTAGKDIPAIGHVGCVAEVTETQTLPDGRSNILTIGLIRYRLESYVEADEPYLVGRISYLEDEEDDQQEVVESAQDVAQSFARIAQAVRVLNDERASLPDISNTEPQQLSFLVSAALEIEADVKQELLELQSTSERLRRLRGMLNRAVAGYEERARIHELAKGNGHGGRKIELE
ncbi:MAG: LON peptidase substrate-binding domain-containing protein [Pyrinomonadaceae bacterium]